MKKLILLLASLSLLFAIIGMNKVDAQDSDGKISEELVNKQKRLQKQFKTISNDMINVKRKLEETGQKDQAKRLDDAYGRVCDIMELLDDTCKHMEEQHVFLAMKKSSQALAELQRLLNSLIEQDIDKAIANAEDLEKRVVDIIVVSKELIDDVKDIAKKEGELDKLEGIRNEIDENIRKQEKLRNDAKNAANLKEQSKNNMNKWNQKLASIKKMQEKIDDIIDQQKIQNEINEVNKDIDTRHAGKLELKNLQEAVDLIEKIQKKQKQINDAMNSVQKEMDANNNYNQQSANLKEMMNKIDDLIAQQNNALKDAVDSENDDKPANYEKMNEQHAEVADSFLSIEILIKKQKNIIKTTNSAINAIVVQENVDAAKSDLDVIEEYVEQSNIILDKIIANDTDVQNALENANSIDKEKNVQRAIITNLAVAIEDLKTRIKIKDDNFDTMISELEKSHKNLSLAIGKMAASDEEGTLSKNAEAINALKKAMDLMENMNNELFVKANPGSLEEALGSQKSVKRGTDNLSMGFERLANNTNELNKKYMEIFKELRKASIQMENSIAKMDVPEDTDPETDEALKVQKIALSSLIKSSELMNEIYNTIGKNMMSPAERVASEKQNKLKEAGDQLVNDINKYAKDLTEQKNTPSQKANVDDSKKAEKSIGDAANSIAKAANQMKNGHMQDGKMSQNNAIKALQDAKDALGKIQRQLAIDAGKKSELAKNIDNQKDLAKLTEKLTRQLYSMAQDPKNKNGSESINNAAQRSQKASMNMQNARNQMSKGNMQHGSQQGQQAKENLVDAKKELDKRLKNLKNILQDKTVAERKQMQKDIMDKTNEASKEMQEQANKMNKEANNNQGGNQSKSNNMKNAGNIAGKASQEMNNAKNQIGQNARETKKHQEEALKKLQEARAELEGLKQKVKDEMANDPFAKIERDQNKIKKDTRSIAEKMMNSGAQKGQQSKGGNQPSKDQNSKNGQQGQNGQQNKNEQQSNNSQQNQGQSQNSPKKPDSKRKTAENLRKASDDMEKAENNIKKRETDEAAKKMQDAINNMKEERDKIDKLIKMAKKELDDKSKEYGDLADRQKQIVNQIKKVKKDADEDYNSSASKSASSAMKMLQEAAEKLTLKKAMEALKNENLALDELRKLRKDIQKTLRKLKEQQDIQKLEGMLAIVKEMIQEQQKINALTAQVNTEKIKNNNVLEHVNKSQVDDLVNNEQEIQDKADSLYETLVEQKIDIFAEEMALARGEIEEVKIRLKTADLGNITQEVEKDIVETLSVIRKALEEARKQILKPVDEKEKNKKGGGSGKNKKNDKKKRIVMPLAELVLVKFKQIALNSKTRSFEEKRRNEYKKDKPVGIAIPSITTLSKVMTRELKKLSRKQLELARYTRDLDGKIKTKMPKDYNKSPRALPLYDVTKEMYSVKKRMDKNLTDNVTKIKQLKIVRMLNKLIKEAITTPQKKKDDKKNDGGKKKKQKKDSKEMQQPQNNEQKNGQKKSEQSKPGPKQKGQQKPKDPKDPNDAKHPGGVDNPNGKDGDGMRILSNEERWDVLRELVGTDSYRSRETEILLKEYAPLIKAYTKILQSKSMKDHSNNSGGGDR